MLCRLHVSYTRAAHDSRLYFIWFLDVAFFGAGEDWCYAVVDDFGNLVRVPS